MSEIKDSGDRKEFSTGAVRDMHEGKGRCDLLPLNVISRLFYRNHKEEESRIFSAFDDVLNKNISLSLRRDRLYNIIELFITFEDSMCDIYTDILELAIHFEQGAKKYGEYNWQKGIPIECYVDSAIRHYLKYLRGDDDERHDRAFMWNVICCIWTFDKLIEEGKEV